MAASFLKLGLKPPSSDLFFSSPFDLEGDTRRRRRRSRSSVACMLCFAAAAAAVAADKDVLLLVSRARQQQQQALQTITTQSLFKSSLLPDVIENVAQESKSESSSSSYGSSSGSSVVVVGAGEETRETGIAIGGVQGEEGLWSIIIPTYDRRPILTKCLQALETQLGYERSGISRYEVIVVDDGSTDGTLEFLLPVSTCSRSGEEKEAAAIQSFCEGNSREENARTTTTTTTSTTGHDSQIRVRVCTSQSGERSSSTRRNNSGFAAARGFACQEPREQIQLSQDLQLRTEAAANDFTTSSSSITICEGVEVSDESSDSLQQSQRFPHVKVIRQQHAG